MPCFFHNSCRSILESDFMCIIIIYFGDLTYVILNTLAVFVVSRSQVECKNQ